MSFLTMLYVRPAKAHTHSLVRAFASRLNILLTLRLLTKHHLEINSLKGGCTGSFESILVNMPHCWKSHVAAHMTFAVGGTFNTLHTAGSTIFDCAT